MNLPKLAARVRRAAKTTAEHIQKINLEAAQARLFNMDTGPVIERLSKNRPHNWSGAVPAWEPMTTRKASGHQPAPLTGVDGSQLYPSADHPVRWGYAQAALYPWAGEQPIEGEFTGVGEMERYTYFDETRDRFSSLAYVDALRTRLEMEAAQAAFQYDSQAIILVDNPLLPYHHQLLNLYPSLLASMKGAALAGYVSSPRSYLIYQLLRLAYQDSELPTGYLIYNDSQLMRFVLAVGQRSAVFRHGDYPNSYLEAVGAGIYFFFLKLSETEIARVEIPEWVAQSPDMLDLIHSSILADSQEHHYPNVLLMAHKTVTIPKRIGRQLNDLALRAFLEHGGEFYKSAKKRAKGNG